MPSLTNINPKVMAKALRQSLAKSGIDISHAQSLELVAQQFGAMNWNILAAKMKQITDAPDLLPLPEGWRISSHTSPEIYRIGLSPDEPNVCVIENLFQPSSGINMSDTYGVVMQSISAQAYRGRKIRFSAEVSSLDADQTSIWLRINTSTGEISSFDNLFNHEQKGALIGSHDWVTRSIVLKVNEWDESIHFGLVHRGYGTLKARNFSFTIVEDDAPVTTKPQLRFDAPVNLDLATPTRH
ncbi:hypothetical protein LMG33818_001252 [Halomonadaceae bacterium LMG 33818]|uniref:glyoxalase superfamily protein n=1 Tax=Cernens ardua TaxID=3402176 RepID=UPI003EDC4E7B